MAKSAHTCGSSQRAARKGVKVECDVLVQNINPMTSEELSKVRAEYRDNRLRLKELNTKPREKTCQNLDVVGHLSCTNFPKRLREEQKPEMVVPHPGVVLTCESSTDTESDCEVTLEETPWVPEDCFMNATSIRPKLKPVVLRSYDYDSKMMTPEGIVERGTLRSEERKIIKTRLCDACDGEFVFRRFGRAVKGGMQQDVGIQTMPEKLPDDDIEEVFIDTDLSIFDAVINTEWTMVEQQGAFFSTPKESTFEHQNREQCSVAPGYTRFKSDAPPCYEDHRCPNQVIRCQKDPKALEVANRFWKNYDWEYYSHRQFSDIRQCDVCNQDGFHFVTIVEGQIARAERMYCFKCAMHRLTPTRIRTCGYYCCEIIEVRVSHKYLHFLCACGMCDLQHLQRLRFDFVLEAVSFLPTRAKAIVENHINLPLAKRMMPVPKVEYEGLYDRAMQSVANRFVEAAFEAIKEAILKFFEGVFGSILDAWNNRWRDVLITTVRHGIVGLLSGGFSTWKDFFFSVWVAFSSTSSNILSVLTIVVVRFAKLFFSAPALEKKVEFQNMNDLTYQINNLCRSFNTMYVAVKNVHELVGKILYGINRNLYYRYLLLAQPEIGDLVAKLDVIDVDAKVTNELYEQYEELIAEWHRLFPSNVTTPRDMGLIHLMHRKIDVMKSVVNDFKHSRKAPFVIYLYGASHTGKTLMSHQIGKHVVTQAYGIANPSTYSRGFSDHWDGYVGQNVCVYDDFLYKKDDVRLDGFLSAASTDCYRVEMAALEEKGRFFSSEVMVLTSNTPVPAPSGYVCNEAVLNRFHVYAEVKREGVNTVFYISSPHNRVNKVKFTKAQFFKYCVDYAKSTRAAVDDLVNQMNRTEEADYDAEKLPKHLRHYMDRLSAVPLVNLQGKKNKKKGPHPAVVKAVAKMRADEEKLDEQIAELRNAIPTTSAHPDDTQPEATTSFWGSSSEGEVSDDDVPSLFTEVRPDDETLEDIYYHIGPGHLLPTTRAAREVFAMRYDDYGQSIGFRRYYREGMTDAELFGLIELYRRNLDPRLKERAEQMTILEFIPEEEEPQIDSEPEVQQEKVEVNQVNIDEEARRQRIKQAAAEIFQHQMEDYRQEQDRLTELIRQRKSPLKIVRQIAAFKSEPVCQVPEPIVIDMCPIEQDDVDEQQRLGEEQQEDERRRAVVRQRLDDITDGARMMCEHLQENVAPNMDMPEDEMNELISNIGFCVQRPRQITLMDRWTDGFRNRFAAIRAGLGATVRGEDYDDASKAVEEGWHFPTKRVKETLTSLYHRTMAVARMYGKELLFSIIGITLFGALLGLLWPKKVKTVVAELHARYCYNQTNKMRVRNGKVQVVRPKFKKGKQPARSSGKAVRFHSDVWARSDCMEVGRDTYFAHVTHVSDYVEAIAMQTSLREAYPEATHHALAFMDGNGHIEIDEDGEHGFGQAIRNAYRSIRTTEPFAIVATRYYGGEHMGTQRWIYYKAVISEAIEVYGIEFCEGQVAPKMDYESNIVKNTMIITFNNGNSSVRMNAIASGNTVIACAHLFNSCKFCLAQSKSDATFDVEMVRMHDLTKYNAKIAYSEMAFFAGDELVAFNVTGLSTPVILQRIFDHKTEMHKALIFECMKPFGNGKGFRQTVVRTPAPTSIQVTPNTRCEKHSTYKVASYSIKADTEQGCCGSPVIHDGFIAGIHFAGDSEGNAYFVALKKREVTEAILKLSQQPGYVGLNVPIDSEKKVSYHGVAPRNFDLINLTSEAKPYPFKRVHMSGKTKIVPSLLHGAFEVKKGPAVLGADDRCLVPGSVIERGLLKMNKDIYQIRGDFASSIVYHLSKKYAKYAFDDKQFIGKIDMDLNLNGREGIGGVEHLNWNSSNGEPYVSARCPDLFEGDVGEDKKLSEFGRKEYERVKKQLFEGGSIDVPYTVYLKDERRTLEKIAAGKTRTIMGGNKIATIVNREYFLDFVAFLHRTAPKHSCAVGVNPFGYHWTMLYDKMQEVGGVGFAADFTDYDGSLYPCFFDILCQVINNFYNDENSEMRRRLMSEICISQVYVVDGLFRKTHGLPSGVFGTAEFNSMINEIIFCYAFLAICEERNLKYDLDDFEAHSRNYYFGDDNIHTVDDEMSVHFNIITAAAVLKKIGITLTTEDKRPIPEASHKYSLRELKDLKMHVPLSEMTFLKRGFIPNSRGIVMAPLARETIEDMVMWKKKGVDYIDGVLFEQIVCENASLEAAFHGPKYHDMFVRQVQSKYLVPLETISMVLHKWEAKIRKEKDKVLSLTISEVKQLNVKGAKQVNFEMMQTAIDATTSLSLPTSEPQLGYGSGETSNDQQTVFLSEGAPGIQSNMDQPRINNDEEERDVYGDVDRTLAQQLAKSIFIGRFDWASTAAPGALAVLNFPDLLVNINPFQAVFNNYLFVNGDLEFTFQVNGNPFFRGKVLIAWVPVTKIPMNLQRMSVLRCVEIDANCSTTEKLYVKFSHIRNMIATQGEGTEKIMGFLYFAVLNQLAMESTATTLPITIYARMLNANVRHPKKNHVYGTNVQFQSKETSTLDHTHAKRGGGTVMGGKRVQMLTKSDVNESDEMDIKHLTSIQGFWKSMLWAESAANDTPIITWRNQPNEFQSLGEGYMSNLAYISNAFSYWRGTIRYRFDICCTQFHHGRLIVALLPSSHTGASDITEVMNNPHYILDIHEKRQFFIDIPYISTKPYCFNTTHLENANEQINTGTMAIYVLNELVSPDQVPNNAYINIYVSGGDDFELAVPRTVYQHFQVEFQSLTLTREEMDQTEGASIAENKKRRGHLDSFTSLKQVVGRYNHKISGVVPFANNQAQRIITCAGVATDPGSGLASSLLAYFSYAYVYYRGSFKYQIVTNASRTLPAYVKTQRSIAELHEDYLYETQTDANNDTDPYTKFTNLCIEPTVEFVLPYTAPYERIICNPYVNADAYDAGMNSVGNAHISVVAMANSVTASSLYVAVHQSIGDDGYFSYYIGCPPITIV